MYLTTFLIALKICSIYSWKNGCAFTMSIWHAIGAIKHLELQSYLRKINWISAKTLFWQYLETIPHKTYTAASFIKKLHPSLLEMLLSLCYLLSVHKPKVLMQNTADTK